MIMRGETFFWADVDTLSCYDDEDHLRNHRLVFERGSGKIVVSVVRSKTFSRVVEKVEKKIAAQSPAN